MILGVQRDFDMAQISITQSYDWIWAYLIATSWSALNSESNKYAKFFRVQNVAPYLTNLFPKNGPFSFVLPKKACRNAKKSHLRLWFCVERQGRRREMHSYLKNGDAPMIFQKNDQNCAKNDTSFAFLVEAPPLLRCGCISPRGIDLSTQNYKQKSAFLKEHPTGWDMGAYFLGFEAMKLKY